MRFTQCRPMSGVRNVTGLQPAATLPLIRAPAARLQPARGHSTLVSRALAVTVDVTHAGDQVIAVEPASSTQTLGKLLPDGSILFTAEELRSRSPSPSPAPQRTHDANAAQPVANAAAAPSPAPAVTPASTTVSVSAAAVQIAGAAAPAQPASAAEPAPAPPQATASTASRKAPAAPAPAHPTPLASIDWAARRRKKVVEEIMEAAERLNRRGNVRKGYRPIQTKQAPGSAEGQKYDVKRIEAGLAQLETLMPGFQPNLDALPAQEWAKLALDIDGVAARLVALKSVWPSIDLSALLTRHPKALMYTPEHIVKEGAKVRELLKTAKSPDSIVEAIPEMLSAQVAASIIVTVNKWYGFKRDPVEILEADPGLVLRAQAMEQPFEPVYEDAHGNWVVPGANKVGKPDWAKHIEQHAKKQGEERQAVLKKQHQTLISTREGQGTTSFVTKSFVEGDGDTGGWGAAADAAVAQGKPTEAAA